MRLGGRVSQACSKPIIILANCRGFHFCHLSLKTSYSIKKGKVAVLDLILRGNMATFNISGDFTVGLDNLEISIAY